MSFGRQSLRSGSGRPARMLASALATSRPAMAGLGVTGRRCGELMCDPRQYCSASTFQCHPCEEICVDGRNFVKSTCEEQCQDYLHDMRYLKKTDQANALEALSRMESDIERLTILVGVMFCLLTVCFVWLAFHACSSRRARCRRRKTADIEADSIQLKSVGAQQGNGTPVIPGPPVISPKANTVPQYTLGRHNSSFLMATKNGEEVKGARGRHPSEDTCPGDYSAAYDNPALAVTPPLDAGGATGHPLAAAPETPPSQRSRDSRAPSRQREPRAARRSRDLGPLGRVDSLRGPPEVDITDLEPGRVTEEL